MRERARTRASDFEKSAHEKSKTAIFDTEREVVFKKNYNVM